MFSFITLICLLHRALVGFHLNRVGCEEGTAVRDKRERLVGKRRRVERNLPENPSY